MSDDTAFYRKREFARNSPENKDGPEENASVPDSQLADIRYLTYGPGVSVDTNETNLRRLNLPPIEFTTEDPIAQLAEPKTTPIDLTPQSMKLSTGDLLSFYPDREEYILEPAGPGWGTDVIRIRRIGHQTNGSNETIWEFKVTIETKSGLYEPRASGDHTRTENKNNRADLKAREAIPERFTYQELGDGCRRYTDEVTGYSFVVSKELGLVAVRRPGPEPTRWSLEL